MNKELTTRTTEIAAIFNDESLGDMYASFNPETVEGKVTLYNAVNTPDVRLADYINREVMIRDVIVRRVKLSGKYNNDAPKKGNNPFVPEQEQEERDGFRVIIIDTDGKSFAATSTGIYNSICTLRNIFGDLHFDDGILAHIKQVDTKNGKSLSIGLGPVKK